MSKEDREKFAKELQQGSVRITDDGIAEDWQRLVANGTIKKIMDREADYKASGGYSELDCQEDIEK